MIRDRIARINPARTRRHMNRSVPDRLIVSLLDTPDLVHGWLTKWQTVHPGVRFILHRSTDHDTVLYRITIEERA